MRLPFSSLMFASGRNSIRGRYLHIAFFITLLLLFFTITLDYYVSYKSRQSNKHLESHDKILHIVYKFQNAISRGDNIVSDHLLSASSESYIKWNRQYKIMLESLAKLKKSSWASTSTGRNEIDKLHDNITKLNKHTLELIEVRLNAEKQFPGIFAAQAIMLPENQKFLSASEYALEEIRLDRDSKANRLLFKKISRTRWLWVQIISNFRMYLINKLSAISTNSLAAQIRDIETYYSVLTHNLKDLHKTIYSASLSDLNMGLETEIALKKMLAASKKWKQAFDHVKKINASEYWRTDRVIQVNRIQPIRSQTEKHMQRLLNYIQTISKHSLKNATRTADDIVNTLWLMTLFGLILIVITYKYFDSRVLKPVAHITEAIKAEAEGNHDHLVPIARFSETQNLVDAFSNMRKQIQARESMLEHQALHDALTKLPNRSLLVDRINADIRQADNDKPLALLLLDLNDFKEVNDSLGHMTGDMVLEQAGIRIKSLLRETDMVARQGGDEFSVLLPNTDQNLAILIAKKISQAIANVFIVNNNSLYIGASIGIALYPEHANNTVSLLKAADVAMYIAKRNQHAYFVYNSVLSENSSGHLVIIKGLQNAIQSGELQLFFQPIVNIKSQNPIGIEALLRWKHPQHGYISPDDIVTIAEHHGLIDVLLEWVLGKSLEMLAVLNHNLKSELYISVNVTLNNLKSNSLLTIIDKAISRSTVPAKQLVLDLPEKAIMSGSRPVMENLCKLKKRGVKLAINDFGSGLSSVAMLKRSPIDTVKIYRNYICNLTTNKNNIVIVKSTINLAHNMGLQVVATGIEDKDTWDLLEEMQSDNGQGNAISLPMAANEFSRWLGSEHTIL